ncbi:podocan-like protein 1 isoform X2 [Heterocephalus glaber]|uniref:Podocan-like protein 1 isoform X2 n=1 Tax=Heterocephalus glaber TaxID=10181 RepID=A0AAX6SBX6_HETGA|nr:podocan-like protein 1 isoform X2 [Heterocephalus glaber]
MQLSLLLLLLLPPGPLPVPGMEDPDFPHPGESSQPPPRACPWRCSCPQADVVDCAGLDLHEFPDNITRETRYLSLQNNQLRELPYNELSHLSALRTLNLHNNFISSEGEGLGQVCGVHEVPSTLCVPGFGQLCGSQQQPLLRTETWAVAAVALRRDGAKHLLRGPARSPPDPSPYPHTGSLTAAAPPPGLPDEAFESLGQLQHLYVAHNQLSVAPQFLPRSLRVADLAANQVTEIFSLTFGEKPALSLSSNRLSYLPPSLPTSLERLHLQNNLISKVPRGALSRQTQLRELYLQHNQLTDSGLDATTFSKLHSLEYLDLSHNRLTMVPAGLPKTLTILHLGRNRIRQVEAARLRGARGLRYLLLQHNELGATGLPARALRPLRNLHALHLYGNQLEHVPPALPRRLWALLMPHNHVAALGARDLASTPGLAELNLAYNRLTSARLHHRAFHRLCALRCLDLAGNQLTQVPAGLPGGLRTLRLQCNQLHTLEPESLAGLGELQELRLAHNRLRIGDIGPGTWHELQALQVLDLSHNELSFVPPDLPEALEELHLQGNRVGHVGPEAFLSTPRLRVLILRGNRLHMTSIAEEAFLGLPHLRVVDTADNLEQVLVRLPSTTQHRPRAGGS